jgi:ABC-type polysaccharide/polyol phosphate export permease
VPWPPARQLLLITTSDDLSFYSSPVEIAMFLQDAPADTLSFMILGYAVILGAIALFIASLVVRFRNLSKDLEALTSLEREGPR